MSKEKPIGILIAKTSLDSHLRGVTVVAGALRDAGMEVIYGGMLTSDEIVSAAIQEDVDVIGLNIGGTIRVVSRIMQLLREKGVRDVLVVAGGTIVREDIPELKKMGVSEVFPPGSLLQAIVDYIKEHVRR